MNRHRKIFVVLIFSVLLCLGFGFMHGFGKIPGGKKRYNLSVCAIFQNEKPYLREWIEYHRLIGVDHFYLYDNNSTDGCANLLDSYIKKGVVTLIPWPDALRDSIFDKEQHDIFWALSTQIPAYENSVKIVAPYETKWLVILDVDEYLLSPTEDNIKQLLEKYDDYPGIAISADYFDSSKPSVPKRKLLIETVELTDAPQQTPYRQVMKMIFKPELTTTFSLAPYHHFFKDAKEPIALKKSELRINHYVNRDAIFTKPKNKLHIDNRTLTEEELAALLSSGYEIEDQERPIYRYVPQLMKKMGYEQSWNWGKK